MEEVNKKQDKVIVVLSIVFMILLILMCSMFITIQEDKLLIEYYKAQLLDFCELAKIGGTYTLSESCSYWIK